VDYGLVWLIGEIAGLGIQVLPITPITEMLFPDVGFVTELVNWAMPTLFRKGVGEGTLERIRLCFGSNI